MEEKMKMAGFWVRLLSFFIDFIIMNLFGMALGFFWPPKIFNAGLLVSLVTISWFIYFVGMTYVFGAPLER